jgi:hypothetical protein
MFVFWYRLCFSFWSECIMFTLEQRANNEYLSVFGFTSEYFQWKYHGLVQIYRNIILARYWKSVSGPGIFVYEFLCRRTGRIDGFRLSVHLASLVFALCTSQCRSPATKSVRPDVRSCCCCMIIFTERKKKKMQIHCGLRVPFFNTGLYNLCGEHKWISNGEVVPDFSKDSIFDFRKT